MTNPEFHKFYLKVSQQYKSLLKVVQSCETRSQISTIEPWFTSVYKKWVNECNYILKNIKIPEAVKCAKMFDEITDFMFNELRDIIENKKTIVIRGFH